MTTTLADLLAGVDMEGGENFCDSVYNFLKNQGKDINLLTNSGFGVWSQSDVAKGLASVPYNTGSAGGGDVPDVGDAALGATSGATGKIISYTITGGGFDTNNAAGVLTLGAVTGTFQTGETINFTDGETAIVGADGAIGVKNDPMNNNSVVLWTDDGGGITLAFVAAEYSVTTTAINQRAWIPAAALTAGKIYKIELDIKDGTDSGIDIQGYFDDGAAQYGRIRTTAGWASVSWTFECATTTAAGLVGFRVIDNMGGSNIQIRRFSCYEITPCCTAADDLAFDGWYRDNTLDIYRQHSDATYTKDGSFYALRCVPTVVNDWLRWPISGIVSLEEHFKQYESRTVTFAAWTYTSTDNHFAIRISDGVGGVTISAYHTGTPGWEWLELTVTLPVACTQFFVDFTFAQTPNVDGSTIVYISQPMLVFGSSIGEGMYQPRLQEWIATETVIASNALHGLSSLGDIASTDLNVEADSDGEIPKGCRALFIITDCNDAGSSGTTRTYLELQKSGAANILYTNSLTGLFNDARKNLYGQQYCDENGDINYRVEATGGNTFDIPIFRYVGVQVT